MNQSAEIGELAKSLAKAQLSISNPEFDAINPHFKNRYATLAAHIDAVRKPLAENGIAVIQGLSNTVEGYGVLVVTKLIHASGQWMSCEIGMKLPDNASAQSLGSIVSYLRRYSLAGMGLLVGEPDEDGEEDRKRRLPFNPAKAAGGLQPKPAKPSGDGFLDAAEPSGQTESLISEDAAQGFYDRLSAARKSPLALMVAIQAQGFDTANGIAGLPMSLLPRIEAWVAKAVVVEEVPDQQISQNAEGQVDTPSRLATLRGRRKGG